jgi:hypothetical protein
MKTQLQSSFVHSVISIQILIQKNIFLHMKLCVFICLMDVCFWMFYCVFM